MPVFEYQAVDAAGKTQKGVLEADTAKQVRQQLRTTQLSPLSVKEVEEVGDKPSVFHRDSLNITTIALITRQITVLSLF